jgi:peptidoglycan hydrolase CwlO-like protein
MKSRFKIALSTGLLMPVFVMAPVLAVETTDTTTTTTTSQQTDDTQKAELQTRVQKRKEALKTKLTTLEQKRLQTKCKNSQGLISNLKGRITGIETSRTQVYTNLVDRLNNLQSKLDTKGADTAELKTEITTLQTKIDTFKTDLAAYKQSVSDTATLDCTTDPTGFKASLEDSRAGLTKVRSDAQDIKTYVNDTIKPTLKNIRATLSGEKQDDTTKTETN